LIVKPNGTKLWWFRYRFGGKEKTLALGVYPVITLKDARERTQKAKKLLADGADPMEAKKDAKAAIVEASTRSAETVDAISREWFEKFSTQWVESHGSKILRRLERDLFPWIGKEEIKNVTPAALLTVLRRVEARGALETAHRLHQNCGQIWRYAVATGRAERDITGDLKGALPPAKETHLGAITKPEEIGPLLRSIEEYKGSEIVRLALRLAPYVFVRPGELRHAEWAEFPNFDDEDAAEEWVIPEGKMKAKRQHVVPLSRQVIQILAELKEITGDGKYLFPAINSCSRCLSDSALLMALRRMGYTKEEMTAHGFRAMASTNLEQLGYDVRLIELQLAHADTNEVRAAYKRDTSRLQIEQRRAMMQHWADYLDSLRAGAQIIPFRSASS
jgi:integrase